MSNLIRYLSLCLAAVLFAPILAGCASDGVTLAMNGPSRVRTDIFPGNYWNYSMGSFQKAENFLNVERAQYSTSFRNRSRVWGDFAPEKVAVGNLGNLQSYFPFDVRWRLKDGREFILENIDVRGISNEYLRKNPTKLQWQRENRPEDKSGGDGGAILAFEIKDNYVLLKWIIKINRTPVNKRFLDTGAATKWDFYSEEYLMAEIPGKSSANIDFDSKYEVR